MRRPTAAAAVACGEPCPRDANITLFSRVTLISKVQWTSDLDYFHAPDLPCSRVKSQDDPISGCRGDSARTFPLYSCNSSYQQRCALYSAKLQQIIRSV